MGGKGAGDVPPGVVCARKPSVPIPEKNQATGSYILRILGFKSQRSNQREEIGGDVVTFQGNCHEQGNEFFNLLEKSDLSYGVFRRTPGKDWDRVSCPTTRGKMTSMPLKVATNYKITC